MDRGGRDASWEVVAAAEAASLSERFAFSDAANEVSLHEMTLPNRRGDHSQTNNALVDSCFVTRFCS